MILLEKAAKTQLPIIYSTGKIMTLGMHNQDQQYFDNVIYRDAGHGNRPEGHGIDALSQ